MPSSARVRLDQGTREAVAERYEHAGTPIERTNCHIVLLADEGRTMAEIAWLVRRGRDQVGKIALPKALSFWHTLSPDLRVRLDLLLLQQFPNGRSRGRSLPSAVRDVVPLV